MLARTARLCMAEAGGATGPLGADSSGVETTRYETVVRPLKREKDFVEMAQKEYLKYHIVAILGLQIILESEITPSNVNDVTMLPPMLGEMGRQGLSPGPSVFHADRGYDSNYNCQILFEMGITPNIKQRSGSVNRGKPYRSRAAKIFDEGEYHQRGMIGGLRRRGVQAPPAALPVHPAGQPPPVRQDPGHRLEHQGAEPVQVRPDTGDRDTVLRHGAMRVTVQVRMLRR